MYNSLSPSSPKRHRSDKQLDFFYGPMSQNRPKKLIEQASAGLDDGRWLYDAERPAPAKREARQLSYWTKELLTY
jgi:hypothetical protein